MLSEVIEAEDADDEDEEEKKPMSDFDALKSGLLDNKEKQEDENGEIIKDTNAVDYSDINELSEDCPKTPPSDVQITETENKTDSSNILEDLEDAIPASKVCSSIKDDKELMPPPSTPVRTQSNTAQETQSKQSGSDSGMDTDVKPEKCKQIKTCVKDHYRI